MWYVPTICPTCLAGLVGQHLLCRAHNLPLWREHHGHYARIIDPEGYFAILHLALRAELVRPTYKSSSMSHIPNICDDSLIRMFCVISVFVVVNPTQKAIRFFSGYETNILSSLEIGILLTPEHHLLFR